MHAHPAVFDNYELLEELAAAGKIDGVEIWHQSADEQQRDRLMKIAQEHNLITTGGSDFHGFYNHYPIAIGTNYTPRRFASKNTEEKNKVINRQKEGKEKWQPI